MVEATVYTIDEEDFIVDQFDCEYEFAMSRYFNTRSQKGRLYVARKGIKIPYKTRKKLLKNIMPSHESQVQE